MTIAEMRKALEARGLIVGVRDAWRNQAFRGAFIVAEPYDKPTVDASVGGYCVVGDNLNVLIRDAYSFFCID